MKLYYIPGACSLASHIMLNETNVTFDIEAVDPKTGETATGQSFRDISPNGYVPALELGEGEVLTEGVAILQYIADNNPEYAYAPAPGTVARARLQQFLNFAAAELHKSWSPLFSDTSTEAEQQAARAKVATKFDHLEDVLSDGREYLVENRFSVADAYTFVVTGWANFKDIDLTRWPNLSAYVRRIAGRASVDAALRAEGLLA